MSVLPPPQLKQLDNQTGLTAFQFCKMAPRRIFCDVVAVKASFDLNDDGIALTPQPGKLVLADTHRNPDDPTGSSLAETGDLILGKPGTDIYVTGNVKKNQPSKRFTVGIRVGPEKAPLIDYQCLATGRRYWQHSLLKGWHMSEPELTESVPTHYELAYGGRKPVKNKAVEEWEPWPDNPAGSGFSFARHDGQPLPAPQWEPIDLFTSMQKAGLTGFGPVARFWASRKRFAGTYDAAWQQQLQEQTIPDFPLDFDMRYFQCAHPQLQSQKPLQGQEELILEGMLKTKNQLKTRLPGVSIVAHWANTHRTLPLDTVHIDLHKAQVHLVWRLTLEHSLEVSAVQLHTQTLKA